MYVGNRSGGRLVGAPQGALKLGADTDPSLVI